MSAAVAPRPSDARRKALNEGLSVPLVSNFFPMERYYEAADKVYKSFELAFDTASAGDIAVCTLRKDACLNDAYVYGKRYCIFCLEELPKHNYYNTTKYSALQRRHRQQVETVISKLERVAAQMDRYEEMKQKAAAERARLEALERDRQHQEKFEAFQRRLREQQSSASSRTIDKGSLEASAMSKLQLLAPPRASLPNQEAQKLTPVPPPPRIQRDPSGEEPMGQPSTRYSILSDDDEDTLPPPLLPSAPPPYELVVKGGKDSNVNGTSDSGFTVSLKLNGDDNDYADGDGHGANAPLLNYLVPPPETQHKPPLRKHKPKEKIPLRQIQQECEEAYRRYVSEGKIRVTNVNTYQGRVQSSTNGCTVISALVVSHHLQTSAVTDDAIVHVIDRQCGPLLNEIRSKLGLGAHALIIPSDVHDHLVDCKLLPQEKFLGAAGGNILDPQHLTEFLKLLAQASKAAATLFFREHVVSFVKYYDRNGNATSYSYDLIDSLPSMNGKATRTRCQGLDALLVLVRWYASRKFSPSDCKYVDRNEWDDNLADVDPRVFQGFVWGEPSQ